MAKDLLEGFRAGFDVFRPALEHKLRMKELDKRYKHEREESKAGREHERKEGKLGREHEAGENKLGREHEAGEKAKDRKLSLSLEELRQKSAKQLQTDLFAHQKGESAADRRARLENLKEELKARAKEGELGRKMQEKLNKLDNNLKKELAKMSDATTRRGQDKADEASQRQDATTRRGQDFGDKASARREETARRGQDFGERSDIRRDTTTRRGQDFGDKASQRQDATLRRGQTLNFKAKGLDRDQAIAIAQMREDGENWRLIKREAGLTDRQVKQLKAQEKSQTSAQDHARKEGRKDRRARRDNIDREWGHRKQMPGIEAQATNDLMPPGQKMLKLEMDMQLQYGDLQDIYTDPNADPKDRKRAMRRARGMWNWMQANKIGAHTLMTKGNMEEIKAYSQMMTDPDFGKYQQMTVPPTNIPFLKKHSGRTGRVPMWKEPTARPEHRSEEGMGYVGGQPPRYGGGSGQNMPYGNPWSAPPGGGGGSPQLNSQGGRNNLKKQVLPNKPHNNAIQ